MADTTHELSILARARDEASAVFKKMGAEGQRAMDGVATSSRRASDGIERLGRGGGAHMGTLQRSAGQVATGLFMLGTAADGAAGKVGQLIQHGIGGFAAGGPWMAGLSVASSLFGILTSETTRAREEQEKLAAAGRAAAAESRRAAEEKTRQQREYVSSLQEEIDLIAAGNDPAKRKSISDKRRVEEAGASGGLSGEKAMKGKISLEDFRDSSRERVRAERDAAAAIERAMEADRALGQSEANRRIGLRKDAEEYVRRASLSAEQLKHDGERQKIAELMKNGYTEQARAMQSALDATIARERGEAAVRARMDEQVESLRALDEKERQMARSRAEEAQKRKADGEIAMKLMLNTTDESVRMKWKTEKAPVERLDSSDPTGGWAPGSSMGPLALAREAKRQRSRDERNQRHADNLRAESNERMGLVDAGWFAPGADVQPRKREKFVRPGGVARNDDGTIYVPGQTEEDLRGPGLRRGGGGRARDLNPRGPSTPSAEDTPYVDGRSGEGAKELGDAVSRGAEGAKGADDSLKQVAADAKSMADSLDGIKASSEEAAGTTAEMATAAQDAAAKQGEVVTALTSAKEAILDWASRVQKQVDDLVAFKDGFGQLGAGG